MGIAYSKSGVGVCVMFLDKNCHNDKVYYLSGILCLCLIPLVPDVILLNIRKMVFAVENNLICVNPSYIEPEDHLVSKIYMTRVEGENTRLRHYKWEIRSKKSLLLKIGRNVAIFD